MHLFVQTSKARYTLLWQCRSLPMYSSNTLHPANHLSPVLSWPHFLVLTLVFSRGSRNSRPMTSTMDDVELSITGHGYSPSKTPSSNQKYRDDDAYLQSLGKRPLLTRAFGFMSILGLSCSALLSWEGILVTSISGLLNGGPAGVVWGFLINWIGTISVYTSLGELASMAPTSGGQCETPLRSAYGPWYTNMHIVYGANDSLTLVVRRSLGSNDGAALLGFFSGLRNRMADYTSMAGSCCIS